MAENTQPCRYVEEVEQRLHNIEETILDELKEIRKEINAVALLTLRLESLEKKLEKHLEEHSKEQERKSKRNYQAWFWIATQVITILGIITYLVIKGD